MAEKLIKEGISGRGKKVWIKEHWPEDEYDSNYYRISYRLYGRLRSFLSGEERSYDVYLPIELSLERSKDYWLKMAEKVFEAFLRDEIPSPCPICGHSLSSHFTEPRGDLP